MSVIVKRLSEPSTWAGLSGLLYLAGVSLEGAQAIGHAGAAVAAALAVLMPEARR